MSLVIYTASKSFKDFINEVFDQPVDIQSSLAESDKAPDALHLIHISSLGSDIYEWIKQQTGKNSKIAICSDQPEIGQMLEFVQLGIKGYCNSYMRAQHYHHMVDLINRGESWFPPQLLEHTFQLAKKAISTDKKKVSLPGLTDREKETAFAVSEGLTNKEIASKFEISERTVKTHLSSVFKKLNIKDRVGLVLHLKSF